MDSLEIIFFNSPVCIFNFVTSPISSFDTCGIKVQNIKSSFSSLYELIIARTFNSLPFLKSKRIFSVAGLLLENTPSIRSLSLVIVWSSNRCEIFLFATMAKRFLALLL